MQEKIIKTKKCQNCPAEFPIYEEDLEFYDKISPVFNGIKYNIPTPTFCPECRQQRRFSFLNERKLYRNTCASSGKPIITVYSPEKEIVVYHKDIWEGDSWDGLDYGMEFDFDKTFAEQFDILLKTVPKPHNLSMDNENSEYAYSGYCKNCYLFFVGAYSESCYYCEYTVTCNYCIDCNDLHDSENCYECMESNNLYKCIHVYRSENSSDCKFSFDLTNCKDCLFCYNLNNKQYCIENVQYSQKEYQAKLEKLNLGKYKNFENAYKKFKSLRKNFIVKNLKMINCEDCLGDNLKNCKNVKGAFWGSDSQDCKYSYMNNYNNDCYDTSSYISSLSYEMLSGGPNIKNNIVGFDQGDNAEHLYYCNFCYNSSYLFGCVGLKHKKYCILNKQYSKEEYEHLVPKIIEHMKKTGEWGEFFPTSISPYGYNETVAHEYFPLTREEALAKGYKWMDKEYPINVPAGMKTMKAEELPEMDELTEEIEKELINTAILCEESQKPYRILSQEIEFYKKHNIPLPRKHQDIRQINRTKRRSAKKLFDRNCNKCNIELKSTYSEDKPETVYCKKCYEKEIYG